MREPPKFPVECTIHSSQTYLSGWLYELGKDSIGPYALIMYERGNIDILYLNNYHSVKVESWSA